MTATQTLVEEHDNILRALDLLDILCDRLDKRADVPDQAPDMIIGFIREYADHLHHAKEEGTLFPAMEASGMPRQGGPIAVMLHEHEEGRAFVREMAGVVGALGDDGKRDTFVRAGRGFVELLREHIEKENMILFPMADRMMAPPQADHVESVFATHLKMEAEAYARNLTELEALSDMLGA